MNSNSRISRRRFLALLAGTAGIGLIPGQAWTHDDNDDDDGDDDEVGEGYATSGGNTTFTLANTGLNANIVVIGGGMAGTTAAKYLRLWGGSGVQVTLVEEMSSYTSNIMSNLVLNGSRTLASLDYSYANLATKYGVTLKQGEVRAIDQAGKSITLANGETLSYDRLVLAPGIEFDDAWGLTQADYESKTPHAWKAGAQAQLLRNQIAAMNDGGVFLMVIPKAPYRCPPGPYERACVVADYLKTAKTGCKVIVLDENARIMAEPENFGYAFNTLHQGVVEYYPGVTGINIAPDSRVVTFTDAGLANRTITANVVNPIPPQRARGSRAGGLLANAGLNNGSNGRWAAIDVLKYESTAVAGIHVLGDAAQTTMPKAGHIANQEAKVCADAILRLLGNQSPDPAPVTNSACYSPVTANSASWLTALYQYDAATATMKAAPGSPTEAAGISAKNFQQMNVWFNTLMSDSFA